MWIRIRRREIGLEIGNDFLIRWICLRFFLRFMIMMIYNMEDSIHVNNMYNIDQ